MKDVVVRAASAFNGSKTIKIVIGVVLVVTLVAIVVAIYKAAKSGGGAAGEIIGKDIIAAKTGVTPERQEVCNQAAQDCNTAVFRVPFFGNAYWCKDDDVVNALNRLVSGAETALTSQFFREQTGESLKALVEGDLFVEKNRKKITYRSSLT